MTPAARDTLRTYAKRMGRPWSEVLREFRACSETQRGALLAEMRAVELRFVEYTGELAAKAALRRNRPIMRLARFVGAMLAKLRPRR